MNSFFILNSSRPTVENKLKKLFPTANIVSNIFIKFYLTRKCFQGKERRRQQKKKIKNIHTHIMNIIIIIIINIILNNIYISLLDI